ncbi:hypothetical protein C8Q76DRAFT_723357 [Earliella scabrosa]|nr:hypothetical protein C8Q76DRAFT_723357 [Earliella scabrosa]
MGSWFGGREKAPAAFLRKAIAAKMSRQPSPHFEIWGDGTQRRSFCYIDDAVDAVLRLLVSDYSQPLNIGSDRSVTVQELANIAIACAGLAPDAVTFDYQHDQPVGVVSRSSDNTLSGSILDWAPTTSLEDGLRITGQWIHEQISSAALSMSEAEKATYLERLQTSNKVDLAEDCIIFAILLPITSRGSTSPQSCLDNLRQFARSLAETTADDVSRSGERYRVHIYLAIDQDDLFLRREDGSNAAEPILREYGLSHILTLEPCTRPRGHVCALWRDCARRAYQDACDYYILMGDDVVLQDANWMSSIHHTFNALSSSECVPHGIGCVAFTDTSFPGMPTFPAIHRTHMDIFGGEVIPERFTNQDGDPFLFQLYRRWGCSTMVPSRIRNEVGGSGAARYDKVHTAGVEVVRESSYFTEFVGGVGIS